MGFKVYTALGTVKEGPADVTNLPFCLAATPGAGQSIAADTPTVMSLTTEVEDTDGMHEGVTNPSRITCRTPGIYTISAYLSVQTFISTANGRVSMSIRKNGTTVPRLVQSPVTAAAARSIEGTCTIRLAAGDYVEVIGTVDNSGTVSVYAELSAIFEGAHAFSIAPTPIPVVTVLPAMASVPDGYEVIYKFQQNVVPANLEWLQWHLKLDKALGVWLPVGAQEPVQAFDAGARNQSFGVGWSQYTGASLVAAPPMAGTYRAEFGADAFLDASSAANLYCGLFVENAWPSSGATPPSSGVFTSAGSGLSSTWSTAAGKYTAALGSLSLASGIVWGCFTTVGQNVAATNRYVELYPRKITAT